MKGPNAPLPSGGASEPQPSSADKIRNNPEYQKIKNNLLRKLGNESLNVVNVEISKKDIEREYKGAAIDQIDTWDDQRKAELDRKRDAKITDKALRGYKDADVANMSEEKIQEIVDAYKGKMNKKNKFLKFADNVINGFRNFPINTLNKVRHSLMLHDLKNQAGQAVEATGRIEAAELAAKKYVELRQQKNTRKEAKKQAQEYAKNEIKNIKDENHFKERIENKAYKIGEFADDANVHLKEEENKEAYDKERQHVKELYAEFMKTVVQAGAKSKKNDKAVEQAREEILAKLKASSNNGDGLNTQNHEEVLKTISKDFRGVFEQEFKKPEKNRTKHQAALDAIDEYLENNLKLMSGRIETGLDMKNSSVKNVGDGTILKYGFVIGTGVTLITTAAKSIARSKGVQLFNTAAGALGFKAGVAGALGGLAGGLKRGLGIRHEEMRQALGNAEYRDGQKNEKDSGKYYNKVAVGERVNDLRATSKLIEEGKDVDENSEKALDLIADARARIQLQKEKKIALVSYEGRESIERQKFDLLNGMTAARAALVKNLLSKNNGMKWEDAEKEINKQICELAGKKLEEHTKAVELVDKAKHKDVAKAAAKGALMGSVAAVVWTFAKDLVLRKDDGIINQLFGSKEGAAEAAKGGGIFAGAKKFADKLREMNNEGKAIFPGGNNVAAEAVVENGIPGSGDVVETVADESIVGKSMYAETVGLGDEVERNFEQIDYKQGASVLFEKDANGKFNVAFDNDGDGIADEEEFLRYSDGTSSFDLGNKAVSDEFSEKLKSEFGLEYQKTNIDVSVYDDLKTDEFLANAENVEKVKSIVSTEGQVNIDVRLVEDTDSIERFKCTITGDYEEGDVVAFDLKGDGKTLVYYEIDENGQIEITQDLADASELGADGKAKLFGNYMVGHKEGNTFIAKGGVMEGTPLDGDEIRAAGIKSGNMYTVVDQNGKLVGAAATDTRGNMISNMSEIANGVPNGEYSHLCPGFTQEDLVESAELADGTTVPAPKVFDGQYDPRFDPSLNDAFKGSPSLLTTPFDASNKTEFVEQLYARNAESSVFLTQNADGIGLLKSENICDSMFGGDENLMNQKLAEWGLSGAPRNMQELNMLTAELEKPENGQYFSNLVNSTNAAYAEGLKGGQIVRETMTERISTHRDKYGNVVVSSQMSEREVMYLMDKDGNYLNNQGIIAREMGCEGGKTGILTRCGQGAGKTGKPAEDEIDDKSDDDETKVKPDDQETKKKPDDQETKKKPDDQETKKKPDDQETKKKPDDQETKKKPDDQETKKKPDDQETKKKPDDQETKKKPDDQETKKKPDDEETKKKPDDQETKKKPDDEETKKKPDDQETKKKPDDQETKKKPDEEEKTDKPDEEETTDKPVDEEITGKTGNMNGGDNVRPMGVTETDPEADYVVASPDEEHKLPGTQVEDSNEDIYTKDAVLDEQGEVMRNEEGEMYVTNPNGTETAEEVRQNIEDDTQTTFTEDTTKYDANAEESIAKKYWEQQGGVPAASEEGTDVLGEAGEEAASTSGRPLATGLGAEETTELGDENNLRGNITYTEEEKDDIANMFGFNTKPQADLTDALPTEDIPIADTVAGDTASTATEDILMGGPAPVDNTLESSILSEQAPLEEMATDPAAGAPEPSLFGSTTGAPSSMTGGTTFTPAAPEGWSDQGSNLFGNVENIGGVEDEFNSMFNNAA